MIDVGKISRVQEIMIAAMKGVMDGTLPPEAADPVVRGGYAVVKGEETKLRAALARPAPISASTHPARSLTAPGA